MIFACALYKTQPALLHASLPSDTPKYFTIFQNQKQSICMSWKTALKMPYNIIHGVPPAHSFIFSVLRVRHMNFDTRISMPVSPPIPLFFFHFQKGVFADTMSNKFGAPKKGRINAMCCFSCAHRKTHVCVWSLCFESSIYISLDSHAFSFLIHFTRFYNSPKYNHPQNNMMSGEDETRKTLSEVFDGVFCIYARGLICGLYV
jgi:hypothetical protein